MRPTSIASLVGIALVTAFAPIMLRAGAPQGGGTTVRIVMPAESRTLREVVPTRNVS